MKFLGHPVHQSLSARIARHHGDIRSHLSARRQRAYCSALRMDRLVRDSARHTRQVDRPVARSRKRGRHAAVRGQLVRATRSTKRPVAMALVLSFMGAGLALLTGWLGGELVDRLGVGVDDGAHLNAPSSLSRRPIR